MTLPNLIIAGVNKAGTTSLFTYLGQHPQVGASAVKETCYFLPLRYGEPLPPLESYRQQFTHCADKPVRLESTPGYFTGGEPIARAIHQTLGGEARIIVILREPVSRLISFFRFKKSTLELPEDLTLAEYVRQCQALSPAERRLQRNNPWYGIEGGQYADFLPIWLDQFGPRLKVAFFDDLHGQPRALLSELFAFMGVDAAFAQQVNLSVENRSTHYRHAGLQRLALAINRAGERFWRRHPRLKQRLRGAYYALNGRAFEPEDDPDTLRRLREHFAPYNARLAQQLRTAGVPRLPAWLEG